MDYNLTGLSTRSFEQLIQAIAAKVIGPNIVVFGDGRDGGREATFEGPIPFPSREEGWNGYVVVQAKFKQKLQDTESDGKWALHNLRAELEDFADPKKKRRKPDYYIFVTNVVLTPFPEKGSKDRAKEVFNEFRDRVPIKDFAIWDYDSIRVFLDDNEAIRNGYAAWITPGDVLAQVIKWLKPTTVDFEQVLTRYLQEELLADQYSNLEKARHASDNPIPIARVFVDLPTFDRQILEPPDETDLAPGFITELLDAASQRLDPISVAPALGIQSGGEPPKDLEKGRFVLIGGPGQGKSTVGQFACQLFRAAILRERPVLSLEFEVRQALKLIIEQCKDEDFDLPTSRRFPIRIELNSFARELASTNAEHVNSVLTYIIDRIRKKTNREVSVEDFRLWLREYPWMIVLDGLDEVPASSNRDDVLNAIRSFRIEARECNADLLILATTRPQGYSQDFLPSVYRHIWLAPLSSTRAMHYGGRLVETRYKGDQERKEKVLERLKRASLQSTTVRLMRTPLQVTIMATLVDRMGQPPQERWDLFRKYYNVIYEREVERGISAATILREYKTDIDTIHRRVGLLLQVESEHSGSTDARLSTSDFGFIVDSRLEERGHQIDERERLRGEIIEAASDRLVFLVGVEANEVGFEIRSLQEFMAAEALMAGSDEDVRKRLRAIGPIANWRNVFLFATGKCSVEREDLLDTIYKICAELNEDQTDDVASSVLAGSQLALDILEDMPLKQQPNDARILSRIALRLLDHPPNNNQVRLAELFDPILESVYKEEIFRRLDAGEPTPRFGGWACLIRLMERQVPWAMDLGMKHWPTSATEQLDLLEIAALVQGHHWIVAKLGSTMPGVAPKDLIERARLKRGDEEGSRVTLIPDAEYAAAPWVGVAAKIADREFESDLEAPVNLKELKHAVFYLRIGQFSGDDGAWLAPLLDMPNPSRAWVPLVAAAKFVTNPSKAELASQIRRIAYEFDAEAAQWAAYYAPWPIAACLGDTNDQRHLLRLADLAESGTLGDVDDWANAEKRWRKLGITEDDIIYLSERQLPFDEKIASLGFPAAHGGWSFTHSPETKSVALRLIELHGQLQDSNVKRLVALWCLFILGGHAELGSRETDIPFEQFSSLVDSARTSERYFQLDALDLVEWPTKSSPEMAQLLEKIGWIPRLFDRKGARENLDGVLSRLVSEYPSKAGIVRLAALRRRHGGEVIIPKELLDVDRSEEPRFKEEVILESLRSGAWRENAANTAEQIARLTASNRMFSNELFAVIDDLPQDSSADKLLLELWNRFPGSRWNEVSSILSLMNTTLKRRNSRLYDIQFWSSLKLPAGLKDLLHA